MDSISYNQTWKLIELPPRKKLITTKWVYKVLSDSSGKPFKFKARLVTRGCEQKEGLNFQKTFAPIIKRSTIKYVIALVAHCGWKISSMHVKIAFLNDDLQEEVVHDPTRRFHIARERTFGL
jgi:hypothetical protein